MESFRTITGQAVSLPYADIDTDIIFPARFLVITEKRGLGQYVFLDRPDLALKAGAPILITGENFGCGSSREQAPWALADRGIRAIVAPSFGEIFCSNCFKNGILPIALPAHLVDCLHRAACNGEPITIDLEAQVIRAQKLGCFAFTVEPGLRDALLRGLDEIAIIRDRFAAFLTAFETRQQQSAPWLWLQESNANV